MPVQCFAARETHRSAVHGFAGIKSIYYDVKKTTDDSSKKEKQYRDKNDVHVPKVYQGGKQKTTRAVVF